nr:hypothetical protein [Paraburkholderia hospita]
MLKGKLLENELLVQQAASNSKEQFANSPDLKDALVHAIIDAFDAFDAHTAMSKQALDSERVRDGLKDILLGPAQLYEALRERSNTADKRPNA